MNGWKGWKDGWLCSRVRVERTGGCLQVIKRGGGWRRGGEKMKEVNEGQEPKEQKKKAPTKVNSTDRQQSRGEKMYCGWKLE